MSLAPTVFSSSDPGAPSLGPNPGSVTAILDAILVNGYGLGASRKDPLGWTIEYSASNKRVYRNNPVTGSGYCIRVDNDLQYAAILRGFSSMTSLDEGLDMFPLESSYAAGVAWPCCDNSNPSLARKWWAIGNERCLYFYREPQPNVQALPGVAGTGGFMGDFISRMPTDPHRCAISACGALASYAGSGTYTNYLNEGIAPSTNFTIGGFVVAKSYDGLVSGQLARLLRAGEAGNTRFGVNTSSDHLAAVYPDPVSGGLIYAPVWLIEAGSNVRAQMPGMYVGLHRNIINDFAEGQILENVPGMPPGTRWVFKKGLIAPGGTNVTGVFFDMTNPWD